MSKTDVISVFDVRFAIIPDGVPIDEDFKSLDCAVKGFYYLANANDPLRSWKRFLTRFQNKEAAS